MGHAAPGNRARNVRGLNAARPLKQRLSKSDMAQLGYESESSESDRERPPAELSPSRGRSEKRAPLKRIRPCCIPWQSSWLLAWLNARECSRGSTASPAQHTTTIYDPLPLPASEYFSAHSCHICHHFFFRLLFLCT